MLQVHKLIRRCGPGKFNYVVKALYLFGQKCSFFKKIQPHPDLYGVFLFNLHLALLLCVYIYICVRIIFSNDVVLPQ